MPARSVILARTETVDPANGPICANCGAITGSAFCPVCGQDTKSEVPTVGEFLHESLDHYGHLEGKLWRTLGMLFFLPGKLSQAYLANKRASYVKPIKLYLAASALAFAAVQFLHFDLGLRLPGDNNLFLLQLPREAQTTAGRQAAKKVEVEFDTVDFALKYVDTPGIRRLRALSPQERSKVVSERGIHYLPYLALGMVPIHAVLLQLLYRNRRRRYGAHLVFSLHTHSFLLTVLVIEAALPSLLAVLLSAWVIVYFTIALKRVYGGTWSETIGRGTILTLLYLLSFLVLGLMATILMLST